MEKTTAIFAVFVFVFSGIFLLGFSPASVQAQLLPASTNCPEGQWDANYGRCKQPMEESATNPTAHITPQSTNCPQGQWDANYGRCNKPMERTVSDDHRKLNPQTATCPEGQWDANYGKCKE